MKTSKDFKDLLIGDIFRGTIARGAGIYRDEKHYTIYKKVGKSRAEIVNEVNYHNNNRNAGGIVRFASYTQTWEIE